MKFGQAFLILLALAVSAGANKKPNLRSGRDLATSRNSNTFHVSGYNEHLGVCHGAVCGLWGDPHILTCDGLGYDCNAQGLFTLMRNFLYNIQANFIHVNTLEMINVLGWGNFPVATYTNDIIIQNVYDENVPVMQFSFPHFNNEEGMIPSEVGCFVDMYYWPLLQGLSRTWVPSIEDCRARCESIPTCTKFTYKSDTRCDLAGDDGVLYEADHSWSRRVAGPVNQCGHPDRYAAIDDNSETRAKAKIIGNGSGNQHGAHWRHGPGCPVNFYKEGELIDISDVPDDGYLYGDSNSDNYAKFEGYNQIKVVFTTESGAPSEIMLETAGDGPGEMFSCHWNMFVCLPEAHEDLFMDSIGIMGSPDNNSQNDWMRPDGVVLPLPWHHDGREGQEAYDYCRNNWCVSQADSLMTYEENATYENVKCVHEDFIPVHVDDPACVETAENIHSVCDSKPMMLRNACEVECCLGNCPAMDEMAEEITGIVELSENIEDCIYPTPSPTPSPLCDDDSNFLGTGETVCPNTSSSIVRVIDSSTAASIPDGQPIIYGITLKGANDDHGHEVSFRVDNPFESNADTYVRYSKLVGFHAKDPACEDLPELVPGCNAESQEITVGCIENPGQDPFAIVDVYFASDDSFVVNNANAATDVEKCCDAPDYGPDFGVIRYSFKIECVCPSTA